VHSIKLHQRAVSFLQMSIHQAKMSDWERSPRFGADNNSFDTPYGPHREQELDHYFDNLGQMRLRNNAGNLTMEDKEGSFTYQLDTSGFQLGELKVCVEGDQIVIHGEHKARHTNHPHDESVERHFTRRVAIPNGIQKDTIQCTMDEKGLLCIGGTQSAVGQAKPRAIPIEFKHSGSKQQQQQCINGK